jgi:hypothetical protein
MTQHINLWGTQCTLNRGTYSIQSHQGWLLCQGIYILISISYSARVLTVLIPPGPATVSDAYNTLDTLLGYLQSAKHLSVEQDWDCLHHCCVYFALSMAPNE